MTDLEEAHHAGFMEGIHVAREIVRKHLLLGHIFEVEQHGVVLKRIEDELALAVAGRMEDAGVKPDG